MFSSPEKRTKKESIASKNKQDSNNQSGFDKNENTSSKKLDALEKSPAISGCNWRSQSGVKTATALLWVKVKIMLLSLAIKRRR